MLDVAGRQVELTREEATALRDGAADRAGSSSLARDVSLLLDRVLRLRQVLALRRVEAQELARLAEEVGLVGLSARICAEREPRGR